MGQNTKIQWTWRKLPDGSLVAGHSWNPWWGCLKVSEECTHCYAEQGAKRYGFQIWGPEATTERRFFGEHHWQEPYRWNQQAQQQRHRRSVFCASMADVFDEHTAVIAHRQRLWQLVETTPWLNWLLLTKRPQYIREMTPWGQDAWPDNIWIGTSVGRQKRAEERLPHLLAVPALVHFVSVEPQLELVNLRPYLSRLQWVICGGESGPRARPFDLAWARDVREQCLAYNVAYFFKQVGGRYHHSGGRLLDGRTWDEMPPEFPG
ncbi:MAG: phage Gp37/Gp68 family protein [Ktedonobacteraceae bacterium]|nr:phage Gp37/Gp68 family protein [Ktedonobacteraceae bacterium]